MKKNLFCLLTLLVSARLLCAQNGSGSNNVQGHFLTDSIELGRPFQYSLTFRHMPNLDVLFPDTARQFAPYRVTNITTFPTRTDGSGLDAISRDSAVYTLVSFAIDSAQLLRLPVRIINEADCTVQWSGIDTIFLKSQFRSQLPDSTRRQRIALATNTGLAAVRQQFNYPALGLAIAAAGLVALVLYGLFGQLVGRQWQLIQGRRRYIRFLGQYNGLCRTIDAQNAVEEANRAVVMWKSYLEELDEQPYASLTTPELAERMNDNRITDALREADQVIYGGTYSEKLPSALRILGDVAAQAYHRHQDWLSSEGRAVKSTTTDPIS